MFQVRYGKRGNLVLYTKVVDEKGLDELMNDPNNLILSILDIGDSESEK